MKASSNSNDVYPSFNASDTFPNDRLITGVSATFTPVPNTISYGNDETNASRTTLTEVGIGSSYPDIYYYHGRSELTRNLNNSYGIIMGNPTTAVFITDISDSSPIVKFRYNIGSTHYYFTAVVTVVASDGNRISSDGLFSRYSSINNDFDPVDPSVEFTDANTLTSVIRNYIGYFIIIRPQGGGGLEESTQIRWPLSLIHISEPTRQIH
jgi:hypothetical protein